MPDIVTEEIKTIETKNLSIGYKKGHNKNILLSDINLSTAKGELIALIGMNGSGKSTLLRSLANFQNPLSGDIRIVNKQITQYNPEELAHKISFVSTERIGLNNITVREIIELGRYPYTGLLGKLSQHDVEIVDNVISQTELKNISSKNLHEISDGEKQRVMIARALAQDTEIIILDEPTAFLDIPNRFEIIKLLKSLTVEKNKTIIFSTHDLPIAMQLADKIWLISQGNITEGAPEDLVLNKEFSKIFTSDKIIFDDIKGDFIYADFPDKLINLIGSGNVYEWTKKALARNSYSVTNYNGNNTYVSIRIDGDKINWDIEKENRKFVVTSIYNLIQVLKNQ